MQTMPSQQWMRMFPALAASLAVLCLVGCARGGGASSSRHPGGPTRDRVAHRAEKESALADALTTAEERRAEAYARCAAGTLHDLQEEDKKALESFEKAVRADPSQEAMALDVARRFLGQKQPEDAVRVLQEAIKVSRSGLLPAFLASIFVSLGRTNEAVTANQEAIKRSPTLLIGYHKDRKSVV